MGLLDLLLNKGGAGVSMSRRETVERLNPILRKAYPLMYDYEAARRSAQDPTEAERYEGFLKTFSVDIGKVAETILSAGGAPYNGIDAKTAAADGTDRDALQRRLREGEEGFERTLGDEVKENHHIRTRAVLNVLRTNSNARLDHLRGRKTR